MPKKAKSGKKGKLAKMTEEERILYLEQKLLAEEEMRRKKEEMLTQYLKDRLSKEEKNTKFNMAKLQNQWRVIMRESKCHASCSHVFCRIAVLRVLKDSHKVTSGSFATEVVVRRCFSK